MRASGPSAINLYTVGGQRKYLSADERRRFLAAAAACPRRDIGVLCATLALTGCRISEALALTPASFDAAENFVAIHSLKKRSVVPVVRQVPVPPWLVDAAHSLARPSATGRIWSMSRCRAWQLVKGVMCDSGIEGGPHATAKGLRHGFGLHAVRCGIPINLVQRWFGHASMTTTAIYLQAIGPEERAIASRMWDRDFGAVTTPPVSTATGSATREGSACPQRISYSPPFTIPPISPH